jgi:hypothetical protein
VKLFPAITSAPEVGAPVMNKQKVVFYFILFFCTADIAFLEITTKGA